MPPTRKRGANMAANNKTELRLGDLVLAKVKGFPAWPAKVSNPEDWDRAPDPKKYFVQFFGMQEIAFVAPADIQSFTPESKSKLLIRCQGKTIRYFAQAVKEICEAFDELQEKKSDGLGIDGDRRVIHSDGTSTSVNSFEATLENEMNNMVGGGSKLERCLQLQGMGCGRDRKLKIPGQSNDASPVSAIGKKSSNHASKEEKDASNGSEGGRRDESISSADFHAKNMSCKLNIPEDGDDRKQLSVGSKRKHEDAADNVEGSDSCLNLKDVKPKKIASGAGTRVPSLDAKKLHLTKVRKNLPSEKTKADATKNSTKDVPDVNKADLLKKRRAIRLYEEDEDVLKTPLHGCSGSKVNVLPVSDSVSSNYNNEKHDASDPNGQGLIKVSGGEGISFPKEHILFAKSSSPATLLWTAVVSEKDDLSRSTEKLESGKVFCCESAAALISPKSSRLVVTGNKLVEEQRPNSNSVSTPISPHVVQHKTTGCPTKVIGIVAQIKTLPVSDKAFNMGSDKLNLSQSQVSLKKSKQLATGERQKRTQNANSRPIESIALADIPLGIRDDDIKDGISSSSDAKSSDLTISIKDLIATARNARMQNIYHGNVGSALTPSANFRGGSPSSPSTGKPFLSAAKSSLQLGLQGSHTRTGFVSPSHNNQPDGGEHENRRIGSGHEVGGSISGDRGLDSAVLRDAFEGMIETLSRTKESIGRATRLAIDCAKHGISNEVVDLLIWKLENEPSYPRRVDLFFLVDSITQCSHSQKGIPGASYIPAVQVALPRLLSAAAPSGAGAQENRQQCLKVLRLWLERKILPESVLRHFMDDIGASDDVNDRLSSRHPSRTERGLDDPLRDIESEQFDEYGSNVTFHLDGFFHTHRFNDDEYEEEDTPPSSCKQVIDESPFGHALLETERTTPSDWHHHILEDVDGELEMEDVSENPKVEKNCITGSCGADMNKSITGRGLDSSLNLLEEILSPEDSPPLPIEPPPPLPPLPSSPPPPSTPPLAPSPIPLPPPTLAPPLHAQMPTPLPPFPLQNAHLTSSLPYQRPPSSSTSQFLFQNTGNELSGLPSGNQPAQMAGNMSQLSTFLPTGHTALQEAAAFSSSKSLDYSRTDMFMASQMAHPKQQFQPGNVELAPAADHQVWPSQAPGNLHLHNTPAMQRNLQHPHTYPYSSPSLPDRRIQFVADEQWRAPSAEYKTNSHHGTWMNDGRTQTALSVPFSAEGYFIPPADGLASNRSARIHLSAAGATAGHNNRHTIPSRSDMSTLNCWRQA